MGICTGGPTWIRDRAEGGDTSDVMSDTADISERGESANTDSSLDAVEGALGTEVCAFIYSPFLK